MSEHAKHRPEDASASTGGGQVAVEPSGYASMLAFSEEERDVIVHSAEEAIASTTGT